MSFETSKKESMDPYTAKAEMNDYTPQEKIDLLRPIIKSAQTGMLTVREADGTLNSRAMVPSRPKTETDLNLYFIVNNASHKVDAVEHDSHVNVGFYDQSTTDWVSYSGTAKLSRDAALIKEHWNPLVSAWFGDLGDGIHKGNEEDPRVSVLEINPTEIRFWKATSGSIGRAASVVKGAVTGKTSVPGNIVTITPQEIQLTQGLHTK